MTFGNVSVTNASRTGYNLLGWFRGEETDGEVTLGAEFNFDTEKVYEERLTLYAGWRKSNAFIIRYDDQQRTVYARDDGSFRQPNSYSGYTIIDYYWDEELTQKVEFDDRGYSVTHPVFNSERD